MAMIMAMIMVMVVIMMMTSLSEQLVAAGVALACILVHENYFSQ